MPRYSIVRINKEARTVEPVVVTGVLNAKNDLKVIDRFTSNFENEDALNVALYVEENEKLSVAYKADGRYKYLPIVYSDEKFNLFTKDEKELTEEELKEVNEHFTTYIHRLLKVAEEHPDYHEYLSMHDYITEHVSGRIREYLKVESTAVKIRARESIIKHLSNYVEFRNWYIGTKAYIKDLSKKYSDGGQIGQNSSVKK